MSVGFGGVTARYNAARDQKGIERSIQTTVTFDLAAGIFLTLLGILITPIILQLMGTPADVLPSSILHFRIYSCGSLGFVMYNVLARSLQSARDSRHPRIT